MCCARWSITTDAEKSDEVPVGGQSSPAIGRICLPSTAPKLQAAACQIDGETKMKRSTAAMFGSLAVLAAPLSAQTTAPVMEPAAAAALDKMGAFLRGLDSFEVKADVTTEDVLEGGQKLQFGNQVAYAVNRPDKLSAEVSSAKVQRRYNYDGATLTVENVRDGYYAQVPMTGNIGALLSKADEKLGISFPLEDLFLWGDPSSGVAKPREGFLVGVEKVGGFETNHFAYRQDGVDFQLWLDNSSTPVPRKMIITQTDDPAQPQYVANFTWNLTPGLAANHFTFVPGPNAKKIKFQPRQPAAAAK
jgi:hypothetical protein